MWVQSVFLCGSCIRWAASRRQAAYSTLTTLTTHSRSLHPPNAPTCLLTASLRYTTCQLSSPAQRAANVTQCASGTEALPPHPSRRPRPDTLSSWRRRLAGRCMWVHQEGHANFASGWTGMKQGFSAGAATQQLLQAHQFTACHCRRTVRHWLHWPPQHASK